jgi:hypothetical protein
VDFDPSWYLATNSDVAGAIGSANPADARGHYAQHGYFEGRLPEQLTVDEAWYRAQYPDVVEAIRARRFWSGRDHYNACGYAEGRAPNAETAEEVHRWNEALHCYGAARGARPARASLPVVGGG